MTSIHEIVHEKDGTEEFIKTLIRVGFMLGF